MKPLEKPKQNGIYMSYADIVDLFQKYIIIELSVFGSSIRDDFTKKK